MGLNKRTYTDLVTVITAQNLNEIQDAIIENEEDIAGKVGKTGAETIAGKKTFSTSPAVPTPANNTDTANKKYVDDNAYDDTELAGRVTAAEDAVDALESTVAAQSSQIAQKDLIDETVFNTVQELVTDSSGQVTQILHKRSGTAYRTDTFAYAENSITETRTITSVGTLTLMTNLTTLSTTVTFVAT